MRSAARGTASLCPGIYNRKESVMKRKNGSTIVLIVILFIGLSLLLYPTVSDTWNSMHQSRTIMSYTQSVSRMDNENYRKIIEDAQAYNRDLAEIGVQWRPSLELLERYRSLLSFDGNGSMGYIDIPKIKITLPIFHGTDDKILQIGIGHIEGSSLPVGGEGSHCILSGHRGLPSAKLFSNLDQLVVGDTFTLNVLDEVLTYEVDQIRVVEPEDLSELNMEEGKDFCTLVTCTPYGINTHRLLLRAHRIENARGAVRVTADALQIDEKFVALAIAGPLLLMLALYRVLFPGKPRKK